MSAVNPPTSPAGPTLYSFNVFDTPLLQGIADNDGSFILQLYGHSGPNPFGVAPGVHERRFADREGNYNHYEAGVSVPNSSLAPKLVIDYTAPASHHLSVSHDVSFLAGINDQQTFTVDNEPTASASYGAGQDSSNVSASESASYHELHSFAKLKVVAIDALTAPAHSIATAAFVDVLTINRDNPGEPASITFAFDHDGSLAPDTIGTSSVNLSVSFSGSAQSGSGDPVTFNGFSLVSGNNLTDADAFVVDQHDVITLNFLVGEPIFLNASLTAAVRVDAAFIGTAIADFSHTGTLSQIVINGVQNPVISSESGFDYGSLVPEPGSYLLAILAGAAAMLRLRPHSLPRRQLDDACLI